MVKLINAFMNIQIRVLAAQAQKQLAATRGEIAALERASKGAGGATGGMMSRLNPASMVAFGSKVQWTGRQLARNFTLPILAAGAAATNFALDNEAAFVRIKKVYGDLSMPMAQKTAETNALRESFEALSNQFGINQAEVLAVAGDWAAAGASGVALAKSTKLTLQTMVLGEMEAAEATRALIAIQAQYGQEVGELGKASKDGAEGIQTLSDTIGILNMVENQTGTKMKDLVDGMARAAGTARSTGVDVQHLAAFMAALVPAAGNAATAGNALKTIFSRVLSPTGDARDILNELGVSLGSVEWNSKTAAERLTVLAEKTDGLVDGTKGVISAQEAQIASVIGSRLQMNKFAVLMQSITDENGYYQKAMKASASDTDNARQAVDELNAVLDSSPHKLKQMGVIIQNSMADVIQPLLPAIVQLAALVAQVARWFANLPTPIQRTVVAILLLLAVLGPLLIFFASLVTAVGVLVPLFLGLLSPVFLLVRAFGALIALPFRSLMAIAGILGGIAPAFGAAGGRIAFLLTRFKQWIAMMTYASGLTGVFARLVVSLYGRMAAGVMARLTAMRGMVVMQFMLMRALAMRQLVAWVTAMSVYFATHLPTNFYVALLAMRTRLSALWVAMGARLVALQALMHARLLSIDIAGYARRFAAAVAAAWARVAIEVGVWTTILGGEIMSYARRMAAYVSFNAGLIVLTVQNAARRLFVTISLNAALLASDFATHALRLARQAAAAAAALAIDVAFIAYDLILWADYHATRIAGDIIAWARRTFVWQAGTLRLILIDIAAMAVHAIRWAEYWAYRIALDVAGHARLLAVWLVSNARLIAVSIATSAFMTRLWARMWLLLTNPAALIRGLAFIGTLLMRLPAMIAVAMRAAMIALTGPWGIAFLAIAALAYAFRDQLSAIWRNITELFRGAGGSFQGPLAAIGRMFGNMVNSIQRAFWSLPQGVTGALMAVVNVVRAAAMKVYELFSYLNPFAHHSPSLVENVTGGMDAIKKQYARVGDVGGIFGKAAADLRKFGAAVGGLDQLKYAKERTEVAEFRPADLGGFDTLVADLAPLNALMAQQKNAVDNQQAVVDRWSDALDGANAALDVQETRLDALKANLDSLTNAYASHKQAMDDYASAPLKGMGAMSDAMFENEMAQKRLQLAMAKMGEGEGVDSLRDKLATLQGDIEALTGEASDLRASGAGSDVLGPINSQIDAMKRAQDQIRGSMGNVGGSDAMSDQLKELQKQAEILQLENALAFDPITRSIEKATSATKELSFEEIIAGINREKAAMDALQPAIDAATNAVTGQQAAVDQAKAARDSISAVYDTERAKLDQLNDTYQETEDLIRDIESALGDMGSAAGEARQLQEAAENAKKAKKGAEESVSPALQNFRDAEGATFADPGANAKIGREGGMGDQTDLIEQFTRDSENALKDAFGGMDFITPVKKKWDEFTQWFADYIAPFADPIKAVWNGMLDGVDNPFEGKFTGVGESVRNFVDKVKSWFTTLGNVLASVWRLIAPDVQRILGSIWGFLTDFGARIGPEIKKWGELVGPFLQAFVRVLAFLGAIMLPGIKVIFSLLGHIIGPVLDTIADLFFALLQVIRGVIEVIVGIVNGDWRMVWQGMKDIVSGTFDAIVAVIVGFGRIVWGVVKGIVEGIFGFFYWLWEELVGHSIVPDMINAIIATFGLLFVVPKWIWDNLIRPVIDMFVAFWKNHIAPTMESLIKAIRNAWGSISDVPGWIKSQLIDPVVNWFQWLWDKIQDSFNRGIAAMRAAWGGLKDIAGWVQGNVIDPIVRAFSWMWESGIKPVLNALLRGMAGVWNGVGEAIARGVNTGIDAINKLIEGLNWIGSKVPGLSFHIDGIGKISWGNWSPPQFAMGGSVPTKEVGAGFKTHGARAIVGEGRPAYPEYVIPTDPRYRNRATSLVQAASKDLGYEGVPMYDFGGVLNAIGNGAKAVGSGVAGAADWTLDTLRAGAVTAAMTGPLAGFDAAMSAMPDKPEPVKGAIMQKKNDVYNWMKGVDDAAAEIGKTLAPGQTAGGQEGIKQFIQSTDPLPYIWGATGPGGYDCSGLVSEVLNRHLGMASYGRRFTTATIREGQYGLQPGLGGTLSIGVTAGSGHMAGEYGGLPFEAASTASGIKIGSAARSVATFARQYHLESGGMIKQMNELGKIFPVTGDPGNPKLDSLSPFAKGGIVTGPTQALIGEAGSEAVIPLDRLMGEFGTIASSIDRSREAVVGALQGVRTSVTVGFERTASRQEAASMARFHGSEAVGRAGTMQTAERGNTTTELHFHGNLEFPSIQSPNDANELLRNLQSLTGRNS